MFKNLVESAQPKAVVQRHVRFFTVISMLWVVTFFTTLIEEIVLAKAELEPTYTLLTKTGESLPLRYPSWTNCSVGMFRHYPPPTVRGFNLENRKAFLKWYPSISMCLSSTYVIEVLVSSYGHVEKVELLKGHPLLAKQMLAAVSKWRFEQWGNPENSTLVPAHLTFRFERGALVEEHLSWL